MNDGGKIAIYQRPQVTQADGPNPSFSFGPETADFALGYLAAHAALARWFKRRTAEERQGHGPQA